MAIKSFKPYSAGRRFMTVSAFDEITASKPEKSLLAKVSQKGGRNNTGKMTVRHQGGGHKRQYRIIDFKRTKDNIPAKVATIEYDPNRSSRIALLNYADGEKRYILAPNGLKVGDVVFSGPESDIKPGNCLPLINILRLPSGEMRRVRQECRATVGVVGNTDHSNQVIGKAGRHRWMGVRPGTRGVVMNPCDHPHGGGEGKSPVGRKHPVTRKKLLTA